MPARTALRSVMRHASTLGLSLVTFALAGCGTSSTRAVTAETRPGTESPAALVQILPAPDSPTPVPDLVTSDLENAIRRHIETTKQANNGLFPVPFENSQLKLNLVRVHTEYLSTVGDNLHFACVDLATQEGDVYDVDFFMQGTTKDAVVTDTMVHKLNGQPYYVWEQGEDERWVRRAPDEASKSLLGVITGKDEFEFTYQATIPDLKSSARMWVPIAGSDAFQHVHVRRINAPGQSRFISDSTEHNRILAVDLSPSDSGKTLEIQYACTRLEKSAYADSKSRASKYLSPERLVPENDIFRTAATEATRGKSTTLERARALYDHTMERIKYMKFGPGWGKGDAMYACDARSGNCTDFHAYFIALCRSVHIPARFAIGASIPSDRSDGGMDGYHCWAEFYADGRWWPVDISEADKYAPLAGYYFGHHPANRFEFSKGRDLVVDPLPQSGPINFLAYPLLEDEGEVVKVKTVFSFRRTSASAN